MATKSHPLSVDAAIKLLISTMRDPMTANVCAIRMGVAADRIDQALEACNSMSEKTKFAKSYPELLRAGMKFLTFNHSPEKHVTMINHLTTCRCDFSQTVMTRLHKPNRYRLDGRIAVSGIILIYDVVATISNLIILNLSELTQHKFRTGSANNGEHRWPQGPEDLLPYHDGPKGSVAALEHWVGPAPHGYIIFKLASCLALFHVPFAKEIFQYPNFSFALYRPCQHLEAAVKFYNEGDSSLLARSHFFNHPVKTIFQFFNDLSRLDTPRYNMMITVRGVWLKPILAPLTTILSTLPSEWREIRMHLSYLSSYANAELDPKTGVALIKFDRSQFQEVIDQGDPLKEAFDVMIDARKRGCWNIKCPSASDILHSRLCSKCNLIRFCGEKCQKDAWKSAPLPHKAVCTKIYSFKESLGPVDWELLWSVNFTYSQFQAICKTKVVDSEVVELIASSISALKIAKSAFLEDLEQAGASEKDRLIRAEQKILARQRLEDLRDSLGKEEVTILNREEVFVGTHRDAYTLGGGGTERRETKLDDLD